jgi:preprotein translocase subunit SecE
MAIVTKDNKDKSLMADEAEQDRPAPNEYSRLTPAAGSGFFSVYKSGQGYWTRLCTAGGAALIIILMAQFIYKTMVDWMSIKQSISLGFVAGLSIAVAIIAWFYMNKPVVVDFFIATESEMKKVNWTSRKDLIGSTKVVIGFMFFMAAILFVIDLFFGYFFWLINVLKSKPF